MIKRYSLVVKGKVQGVFFRDAARREAERLGVAGFAQNEPNGDVYIEAEGDTEALNDFTEWCRRGPAQAEVVSVATAELPPDGLPGFRIS